MLWFSPRNVGPLDRGNAHAREVGSVLFGQMVGWIDATWWWGAVLGLGRAGVSSCGDARRAAWTLRVFSSCGRIQCMATLFLFLSFFLCGIDPGFSAMGEWNSVRVNVRPPRSFQSVGMGSTFFERREWSAMAFVLGVLRGMGCE